MYVSHLPWGKLFFCLLAGGTSPSVSAQLLPVEGARLYHRIVLFHGPEERQVAPYTLEVAEGSYEQPDVFSKHIIVSKTQEDSSRFVEILPHFGVTYTWRLLYGDKHDPGPLHHFYVEGLPAGVGDAWQVLNNSGEYEDQYVLTGGTAATVYNAGGKALAYVPLPAGERALVGNPDISDEGSLTCLLGDRPAEITLDGTIRWQAPMRNKVHGLGDDHYHDKFVKLINRHFVVMGTSAVGDRSTLVEFDRHGGVVWSWSEEDHLPEIIPGYVPGRKYDLRASTFFFDQRNNVVFINYSGINRVVKVAYPDGNVIAVYGALLKTGPTTSSTLFCAPRVVGRTMDDLLLCYNGTSCDKPAVKGLLMLLKEPPTSLDTMKLIKEIPVMSDIVGLGSIHCMGKVANKAFLTSYLLPGGIIFQITDFNGSRRWSARTSNSPVKAGAGDILSLSQMDMEKILWLSETESEESRR